MSDLSINQVELLKLLERNIDDPLTIREIMEELSLSSTSVAYHHIQQLEKKGYLKRNPDNPRDYQLLKNPEKPVTYLNQYGLAQCGPKGSILDGNPIERIPIASRLLKFPTSEGFIVKARGDSMEPLIKAGDYVIAQKKNTPNNNDIVVCVYNQEALIKKIFIQDEEILLRSINNEKYPPILVKESTKLRIEGVVRNIIKYAI